MRRRPVVTALMLTIAVILPLPLRAKHNVAPNFSSAHAGLEVGARTVGAELKFSATTAQTDPLRGISVTTAISSDPGPAGEAPKKPLNQVQVFALLRGGQP